MSKMINLIDVGCVGEKIPAPWRKHKKHIDTILTFDPLVENHQTTGLNSKIIHYNCAVFSREGKRNFYICNKEACSSLLKMNYDFFIESLGEVPEKYQLKETKEVNCIRLDSIIDNLGINFDFIKTDAQGADLEVIKSLGRYLDEQIIGVHIELYFQPHYSGMSLFDEANAFLKSHNFEMVKSIRKKNTHILDDFLYIRQDAAKKRKIKFIRKIYKW